MICIRWSYSTDGGTDKYENSYFSCRKCWAVLLSGWNRNSCRWDLWRWRSWYVSDAGAMERGYASVQRAFRARTDGLLFTHLHPDHYNKALTEQYLAELKKQGKRISCYGPEWEHNNVAVKALGDGMSHFRIGTAEIITEDDPWRGNLEKGSAWFFFDKNGRWMFSDSGRCRAFWNGCGCIFAIHR
mgnify:CR=1 FL=1